MSDEIKDNDNLEQQDSTESFGTAPENGVAAGGTAGGRFADVSLDGDKFMGILHRQHLLGKLAQAKEL